MFELKSRDGLGRIGRFTVNDKSIVTPNIAVVVNPNNQVIPPRELYKDFGVDLIITNAYIIKRSKKKIKNLHEYYKFPGLIYTDSGAYQMYSKGGVSITNEETLRVQKEIGSDILTPLDVFTFPDDSKRVAKEKLIETNKRIIKSLSPNLVAPIQGGLYLDLRRKACRELSGIEPLIYAVGGIVPLIINYDYKRLIEIILACKQSLPSSIPIHAFGVGHPIVFSLLALAGVDLFDSASYVLYARDGRYLTEFGTRRVSALQFLPCSCPTCMSHSLNELRNDFSLLARHNLYIIMREIKLVREAIHSNKLFNLVSSRVHAHPSLYYAYKWLLEQKPFMNSDPVTKRSAFFWTGELSNLRPELLMANERLKELGFRKVPRALNLMYPYGQSEGISFPYLKKDYTDIETLRLLADYQLSKSAGRALFPDNIHIEYSRNERINKVFLDNKLLCVLRASDGHLILHKAGALRVKKFLKKIIIQEDVAEFPGKGGNVFAKHVLRVSSGIIPGMEVLVMSGGRSIAVGEALLNSKEMKEFKTGVAVIVREGFY